jgi:hypothetical protein
MHRIFQLSTHLNGQHGYFTHIFDSTTTATTSILGIYWIWSALMIMSNFRIWSA